MRYLYTKEPDDHCHEVEPGIYGRPAHTTEQPKLKAKGWTYTVNELKEADHGLRKEEGREEEQVIASPEVYEELRAQYEDLIGKKPHHKLKAETLQAKINEALKDD